MSRLDHLYKKKLRGLANNPFQFKIIENATHVFTAYNPLCGDKFTFYLKVENNIITNASFYGFGCAISKASSSILTSKLINKKLEDLPVLVNDFLLVINNKEEGIDDDYKVFRGVQEFPERLNCVTLGWDEMNEQLKSGKLIQ